MILKHKKGFVISRILMSVLLTSALFVLSVNSSAAVETSAKKDSPAGKKAVKMEHEMPLPGELCVTCHMEMEGYESDTPKINTDHEVCNKCHKKDGTIAEGHCGCEDADNPMDCEQCHTTPAMGNNPSAEDMNKLCIKCH